VRPPPEDPGLDAVRRKAARMMRARRAQRSVWSALAQGGAVGWQLALPLVLGAGLGHLAGRFTGRPILALLGLLLGLAAGLWGAGRALQAALRDEAEEEEPP
jgi:ATP synthase protein I